MVSERRQAYNNLRPV